MTLSRRHFLRATAGAAAVVSAQRAVAAKRSATDWVTLGNWGVEVTRPAFGTGTFGGRVQRELGQAGFTRLVRHAYDRGIWFFESADAHAQMHEMLAVALRGIPRESYRLMTKLRWRDPADSRETIDRFRRELNSDYLDILLLHNVRTATWPADLERLRDALSEAKHRQLIRAHGASCHGLRPLSAFPGNRWLEVALLRINHDGTRMDNLEGDDRPGDHAAAITQIQRVHAQRTGVLGMKLMGEGRFTSPEQRDASIRFVVKLAAVDAVTIGFRTTAEIDEAIERMNTHLNS